MDIFQEKYGDPEPFFARIFTGIKEDFRDEDPDTKIQHISIDYQVWKTELKVVEWAELYHNEENASMSKKQFLELNLTVLRIDKKQWRRDHAEYDRARIPHQVVSPQASIGGKAVGVEGEYGDKYMRFDKRAVPRAGRGQQRQYGQNAPARGVNNQPVLQGALGAGRGAGQRGFGGRGGGNVAIANRQQAPAPAARAVQGAGAGGKATAGPCLRDLLYARKGSRAIPNRLYGKCSGRNMQTQTRSTPD